MVGVYAFETGGNGTYDMQAGVSPSRPPAISPAIGYNQLLSTNSVSLLAEHGTRLLAALRQSRDAYRRGQLAMEPKIEAFTRMVPFTRTSRIAGTSMTASPRSPQGLGIHAAI